MEQAKLVQGTDVRQRRAPVPDTAAQKDVPCKTLFLRSLLSLVQQHPELTGDFWSKTHHTHDNKQKLGWQNIPFCRPWFLQLRPQAYVLGPQQALTTDAARPCLPQPESRRCFPGAKGWAKTWVMRACLQCEDHGLWWKGAWAHKWHVPNFTSHVEAGSRAAGRLLCHLHIPAGQGHQSPSTLVQQRSDIQGRGQREQSKVHQEWLCWPLCEMVPAALLTLPSPACICCVWVWGALCCSQLSPMALLPVSVSLCQWLHQPGMVCNGSAKAARSSSSSGQDRISAPKDRLLREAFQRGRGASEEGSAEHTASFSTSELACFSLQCAGPVLAGEMWPWAAECPWPLKGLWHSLLEQRGIYSDTMANL